MPNHVTNIVTYEGDRKQIAEMLEAIKNDEFGIGTVDFQKIIPMPDDIYTGNFGPKERELYGDKNWYDWRRANWGTKWGAYGYEEGFDYSQTDSLWFQTAWSAPHPILQKLTEMFPEIKFKHQWADEDIGYNCGQHRYHGGERTDEFYPESEFDRIRFAAEVLEVDPQEYGLFLNETNTAFIQLPDEDFELIEIAGQTALFINSRYTDEKVPMGLHCYQLRHSDYGANFISLERRVGVNFGGTVITKESNVTVIPAKPQTANNRSKYKQLRVAAYCRVSTEQEEQQNSYQVQIEYYTDLIHSKREWTLAGNLRR